MSDGELFLVELFFAIGGIVLVIFLIVAVFRIAANTRETVRLLKKMLPADGDSKPKS